MGNA
jgi:hypothetical protein